MTQFNTIKKLNKLQILFIGDNEAEIRSLFLIAFNNYNQKDGSIFLYKGFFSDYFLDCLEGDRFLKYKIKGSSVILSNVDYYQIRLLLSSLYSNLPEVYGKEKQINLTRSAISKKQQELENTNLIFSYDDFDESDKNKIEIIGVMSTLEKTGEIKINNINTPDLFEEEPVFENNSELFTYKKLDLKFNITLKDIRKTENNITKSNKINQITCIKPSHGSKYNIIINNNYYKTIEVDKNIRVWGLLLELSINKIVELDKHFLDYINSSRNQLITKFGYNQTKIVKIDNDNIVQNIPIEAISEKSYKTKINKINLN
ncbi:MAG: hypothetical protein PHQ01_02305 [Candidatus Pacebacteria bacterium]|nr:hypothetical protein [Bacteroidales bacterium]MDD3940383.1 hypothetical protein [Candidatus Paceibacterota bacterium]